MQKDKIMGEILFKRGTLSRFLVADFLMASCSKRHTHPDGRKRGCHLRIFMQGVAESTSGVLPLSQNLPLCASNKVLRSKHHPGSSIHLSTLLLFSGGVCYNLVTSSTDGPLYPFLVWKIFPLQNNNQPLI